MELYLLFYMINILFAYMADRTFDAKRGYSVLFLGLIIIVHTLFLGLRDFGVGIDTTIYIDAYYNEAMSLSSFSDVINSELHDIGFLCLAWLSTFLNFDSSSLMIVTEFFIILFIVCGTFEYKKALKVSLAMQMALFCFMYSMHTINLMRQGCAVAMLFYGFALFLKGDWKGYAILQLLAFFFHSSSIFFVIVPILYKTTHVDNNRMRILSLIGAIFVTILLMTSYYSLVASLGDIGILSDVYSERYGIGSDYAKSGFDRLGIRYTIMNIVVIWGLVKCRKKQTIDDSILYFSIVLYVLTSVIIQYLPTIVNFIGRIGHYTLIIWMIYYAKLLSEKEISFSLRCFIFIFSTFIDWYMIFIVANGGDVIPYTSKLLDI